MVISFDKRSNKRHIFKVINVDISISWHKTNGLELTGNGRPVTVKSQQGDQYESDQIQTRREKDVDFPHSGSQFLF